MSIRQTVTRSRVHFIGVPLAGIPALVVEHARKHGEFRSPLLVLAPPVSIRALNRPLPFGTR